MKLLASGLTANVYHSFHLISNVDIEAAVLAAAALAASKRNVSSWR